MFDPALFDGAFFDVQALSSASPRGGRVRKEVRYAAQIEGQWLSFASMEDLQEYLDGIQVEKLEVAEKRAEKAVQRILKVGESKTKPPQIKLAKASVEVREYVDQLNEQIERIYRKKITEALAAQADEEDIEILLGVI